MWWWNQALIKNVCCLSLFALNFVTTWQDDRSKFSWLSKYLTCSRSNSRGCKEICSCSKWTEFGMASAAWGTAGVEERLGSWKYCKLATGTYACIWDKVFPFVSFLTSLFWGFIAKLVLQRKVQWLFLWFLPAADLMLYWKLELCT